MANNIESPCPDECPLRGMTHQHYVKGEGQPKRKKKHRRVRDDDNQFMVRRSEQKKLYKRKR